MVYCHECGSEIAEAETFCPFCGISLKPVGVDVEEDSETELTADKLHDEAEEDLDMSETIVVNPSSLAEEKQPVKESGYIDISTLKAEDEEQEKEATVDEIVDEAPDFIPPTETIDEIVDEAPDFVPPTETVDEIVDESPDFVPPSETIDEIVDEAPDFIPPTDTVDEIVDESPFYVPPQDEKVSEDSNDESSSEQTNIEENVTEVEDSVVEVEEGSDENSEPSQFATNEEEIDEAVAVIDSKADVWKTDDEYISTDALKDKQEIEPSIISKTPEISETFQNESEVGDTDSASFQSDENPEPQPILIDSTDVQLENSAMNFITDEEEGAVAEALADEEVAEENPIVEPSTDEVTEMEEAAEAEITPTIQEAEATNEAEEIKETEDETESEAEEVSEDQVEQIIPNEPAQNFVEESAEEIRSETTPNIGLGDTDGSKAPKLKPLDEGTVLNGRYEIVRKIGGGGMGAVYLANDKNLGGVLRAVKEMVQSYIEEEQQEKAVNDFKRESMLLTSLDHPSIPTIYDYFFDDKEGRFYLVMKYISGGDLSARLRSAPEGKLDEISVTEWALQITEVLDYLHSRQPPIVYRDLKPANIMVDGNSNRAMLIDFGIARWINKEEKGVTAVGTMGYAPPELFSGNVEPGSDIYSLGSTMFHLLTGADPQSNPLLIFDFQKHPRPRQINSQISDQMERILMRAVEYSANRRFASAAEMRNALSEHLENLKSARVSYGVKETPMSIPLSDQPVFCGFCGQKIVATDMFCAFCGAKQPMAQPGVHSEEYNLGKMTARLIIEGTSELDYPAFDLVKKENLVGRRDPMSNIFPEVDLSKYDPQTKISRKHARIRRDGEAYILEDLGSSNGTILIPALKEKMRVEPHQPQVLQNGDKIVLGDTTLQFIVG